MNWSSIRWDVSSTAWCRNGRHLRVFMENRKAHGEISSHGSEWWWRKTDKWALEQQGHRACLCIHDDCAGDARNAGAPGRRHRDPQCVSGKDQRPRRAVEETGIVEASELPPSWLAEPAGLTTIEFGDAWLAGGSATLLLVPSIIVPEEYNVLINPAHPESRRLKSEVLRQYIYDPRL